MKLLIHDPNFATVLNKIEAEIIAWVRRPIVSFWYLSTVNGKTVLAYEFDMTNELFGWPYNRLARIQYLCLTCYLASEYTGSLWSHNVDEARTIG